MKGLYGQTHFELEKFIDMKSFDNIQLDILKGIATAKPLSQHGYLPSYLIYNPSELSEDLKVEPLMKAYQDYKDLPETDPIKEIGLKIKEEYGHNGLTTFLKYVYGAHDLYYHYLFWDYYKGWSSNPKEKNLSPITSHFTSLMDWFNQLVLDGVFFSIGRAYLIAIDSNGHSFEHRDPPLDPDADPSISPEFIHIRPTAERPFYVYDPDLKKKYYIESRVGWWNDRDIHGGEVFGKPSYAIRIDGIFTDEFRKKIGTYGKER
jgi:hypothetical protein